MTHTPSLEIPEMRYLHHLLYHFDDIDQRTKIHHFIDFMVIHQFLISLMITEYIPITKNIKSLLFNKKSSFETTTSIITVFIELLCVDELLDMEEGVLRRIGGITARELRVVCVNGLCEDLNERGRLLSDKSLI